MQKRVSVLHHNGYAMNSIHIISRCITMGLCLFFFLITNAQSVFRLQNGSVIKAAGGVVITLQDMDLLHEGNMNIAPGEAVIRFAGTQDNIISGNVAPLLDVIQVAKTNNARLILNGPLRVGSSIQFNSGNIDLNSNNILMEPSALLIGESEASHITGISGGYIEVMTTLNAPAAANPGNLGVIISSASNLGNTTIRRGHISYPNVSGSGKSIRRYYDIIPTNNSGLNATLRFNYLDAELDGLNENTVVMWKSPDNLNWLSQGFSSRDASLNFLEKTGIADFSRWTLADISGALPVEFVLFNLYCQGDKIQLNWKTAQELNSDRFEIQKSTDGIRWLMVGQVKAAGNSFSERSYSFVYDQPDPGISYYRIAEFDLDGTVLYTSSARSNCNDGADIWKAWPNPVQELLWINLNTAVRSGVVIKIFDSKGALVKTQQDKLLPGINQLRISMQQITAGVYHVTVEWNDGQMRKNVKVIKR